MAPVSTRSPARPDGQPQACTLQRRCAPVAVCHTVSAKGTRHHPHVRMRRWFLTAKRAMLAPRDRCARCRPHHTPDAGAEGPQVLCLSPKEQQTLWQNDERKNTGHADMGSTGERARPVTRSHGACVSGLSHHERWMPLIRVWATPTPAG